MVELQGGRRSTDAALPPESLARAALHSPPQLLHHRRLRLLGGKGGNRPNINTDADPGSISSARQRQWSGVESDPPGRGQTGVGGDPCGFGGTGLSPDPPDRLQHRRGGKLLRCHRGTRHKARPPHRSSDPIQPRYLLSGC